GSQRTGVGIIDVDAAGRASHVFHAPLDLLAGAAAVRGDLPQRLRRLVDGLRAILDEHRPDEAAIEQVFVSKNADSALKLGQARGAAICAVVMHDLPVSEYGARQAKLALVGKGAADKRQVPPMAGAILRRKGRLQADAADALAIAITHAHTRASAQRMGIDARMAWSRR